MKYSRTLRWLNQMKDKLDAQGNLNEEYLAWCRSNGYSEASISSEQARLHAKYQSFRKLDEELPEEWFDYTAYEAIFTSVEREKFHPDGSIRQDYIEKNKVTSEAALRGLERESRDKMIDVDTFNKLVKQYAAIGINYAKTAKDSFEEQNRNAWRPLNERELADLRNFEEISSLTADVDPSEYYPLTQNQ